MGPTLNNESTTKELCAKTQYHDGSHSICLSLCHVSIPLSFHTCIVGKLVETIHYIISPFHIYIHIFTVLNSIALLLMSMFLLLINR